MPSALFGTPPLPPPAPVADELPFAEEEQAAPTNPAMVNTIFGQQPKPKLRRKPQ